MQALSISLPDALAKASQQVAKSLGISRTQFIRLSIAHELQRVERQSVLEKMAESFKSMQTDPGYLEEYEEIAGGFDDLLAKEKDEWWKK